MENLHGDGDNGGGNVEDKVQADYGLLTETSTEGKF